jgi:uncharacterized protein (TIGR02246 family)
LSQQTQSTNQADAEAIKRLREVHIAALNDGDADAWAGTFTDDGVQMPPNAPANIGHEGILKWSRGFLAPFRIRFALLVDEVQAASTWAFESGTYNIDLTPKSGGGSIQDVGKYITVYQRQPTGTWKIARDIWNSNNPPFTVR